MNIMPKVARILSTSRASRVRARRTLTVKVPAGAEVKFTTINGGIEITVRLDDKAFEGIGKYPWSVTIPNGQIVKTVVPVSNSSQPSQRRQRLSQRLAFFRAQVAEQPGQYCPAGGERLAVFVAGVGMLRFGRYPDRDVPDRRHRGPGAWPSAPPATA